MKQYKPKSEEEETIFLLECELKYSFWLIVGGILLGILGIIALVRVILM